jgi:hypothetical protein
MSPNPPDSDPYSWRAGPVARQDIEPDHWVTNSLARQRLTDDLDLLDQRPAPWAETIAIILTFVLVPFAVVVFLAFTK